MNELSYASLEASKRLHDAGIVLETSFSYFQEKPSPNPNRHSFGFPQEEMPFELLFTSTKFLSGYANRYNSIIPAPSMAEVWRELPPGTGLRKAHSFTEAFNFTDTENADSIYPPCNSPDNPTDALIDLLIWVRTEAT